MSTLVVPACELTHTPSFNARAAPADGGCMSGPPVSGEGRFTAVIMVAAALVGACGREESSAPRSLNPDEAAFQPWDVIGVVVDSAMRHSAVGPEFQRGTLSLVDGTSIEVTDDPVGIGSGTLVLRPRPTGDEQFFSLDDDAEPDPMATVEGHTGSCAEGAELDAMSFFVNAAGEITGFAGYGAAVDGGFADDPCATVS